MNFNKKEKKRGLSSIVTTLIIIVLSLVAVGVVWGVVSNLLKSNESQANFQFGTLFLDLKIEKVLIEEDGDVSISVSRGTGEGDLREIDFIVSDGTNSQLVKRTTILGELGTQLFTLTPAEVGDLSSIYEVSIAPVINSGGTDKIGSKVDTIKSNYYNSCAGILNAGQSNGNGIYTIDPDGLGSGTSFQVNCDMTRDGGGWTQILKNWYGTSASSTGVYGVTGAVGSVTDGLVHLGNGYKLSDDNIRAIIGTTETADYMMDQSGYGGYSTGNYEYVILRDYKGRWRFDALVEKDADVIAQSYRLSDNKLIWTGTNLDCGAVPGVGINCAGATPSPRGGSGCDIDLAINGPPWEGPFYFCMGRSDGDTYLFVCNGPQYSYPNTFSHRVWIR